MASNLLPLNFSMVWCSSRFCSWSSSLHTLHNSTQFNNISIICQCSMSMLYADDTQLFLSFSVDAFSENILLLQNTISNISSWMASNFLSLNPVKTEFLLIGLPAQLAKIHTPTLTISSNTTIQSVSSARNLGVIFDSNLSFSDHISYISKSCFSHIRDLRHIRSTLDHKTACTIATSLIHSKLDYLTLFFSTSAVNNSISFNLFLTLLLVLSQKLQNFITLLLILNHFTGSELHNAYNIKFFH